MEHPKNSSAYSISNPGRAAGQLGRRCYLLFPQEAHGLLPGTLGWCRRGAHPFLTRPVVCHSPSYSCTFLSKVFSSLIHQLSSLLLRKLQRACLTTSSLVPGDRMNPFFWIARVSATHCFHMWCLSRNDKTSKKALRFSESIIRFQGLECFNAWPGVVGQLNFVEGILGLIDNCSQEGSGTRDPELTN